MTNDEIMALTPEQLRVEIAKAKGWNVREKVYRRREEGYSHDTEIKELVYGAWPDCFTLPNWPGDIAAAYALEDEIPHDERAKYAQILTAITRKQSVYFFDLCNQDYCDWMIIHATAEQRCRAWLMWKENRN